MFGYWNRGCLARFCCSVESVCVPFDEDLENKRLPKELRFVLLRLRSFFITLHYLFSRVGVCVGRKGWKTQRHKFPRSLRFSNWVISPRHNSVRTSPLPPIPSKPSTLCKFLDLSSTFDKTGREYLVPTCRSSSPILTSTR